MGGPAWLAGIFAAASLAVAVYCAGRLVVSRRWHRPTETDIDGAHVVMGVAMAGMLVSALRTLPSTLWEVVFALGAAWFGYRMAATRSRATLPHLVECAAMVFMFVLLPATVAATAASGGMGGMSMSPAESRFSFLTLALALFLFGYVVYLSDGLTLRRLLPVTPAPAAIPTPAALAVAAAPAAPSVSSTNPDSETASVTTSPAARYLAPRCATICKITMGITMGYMLVLML